MKFLITAGPTREPIDPVRFISNRSSGKMGYAIARAALAARHEVVLVSGPVCLAAPDKAEMIRVTTGDEMFDAVQARLADADALVMAAAVSDFKPAKIAPAKIKKSRGLAVIALEPTRDILSSLNFPKKKPLVVGFAAETESLLANALEKLGKKNCDLIIGNDVSRMDTGLESEDNEVLLCFRNGEVRILKREKKALLAQKLVRIFERMKEKR